MALTSVNAKLEFRFLAGWRGICLLLTVKYAQLTYYECIARIHRRHFSALSLSLRSEVTVVLSFSDVSFVCVYLLWLLVFISCRSLFNIHSIHYVCCESAYTKCKYLTELFAVVSFFFSTFSFVAYRWILIYAYIMCEIPQNLAKIVFASLCAFIDAICVGTKNTAEWK